MNENDRPLEGKVVFESVTGATIKMDGGSSIPRW
jgi:hypothetical protein